MRFNKSCFCLLLTIALSCPGYGQNLQFRPVADLYYRVNAFDPSLTEPEPVFYAFNRQQALAVNLAALQVAVDDSMWRLRFTPAFGTFMEANFAAEPRGFRHLLEASGGVKLHKTREVWLDMGILGSPFGYEGSFSALSPQVTRSFSAENSPYILTGVRLGFPLGAHTTAGVYVVNGWQTITETNSGKALAFQVQRDKGPWLLNYSVYGGDETPTGQSLRVYRLFQDAYALWRGEKGLSVLALADAGLQSGGLRWFTANLTGAKSWKKWTTALRGEYFTDPSRVVSAPENGFSLAVWGGSAQLDYSFIPAVRLRTEVRYLRNERAVFVSENGFYRSEALFFTLNLSFFPETL